MMAEIKQEDHASLIDLKKQSDSIISHKDKIVSLGKTMSWRFCNVLKAEIDKALTKCDLGLDFSKTSDDISLLKFTTNDSLEKLKHACDTEIIKDFLQSVFIESGAKDVQGIEDFTWKFSIRLMSPEEYKIHNTICDTFQTATKEAEKKIWKCFATELDPEELFDAFMKSDLIVEKSEVNVLNDIPRKQQMEFLIGRLVLVKGPDEGFNILRSHCMKHGYHYLCETINDKYTGDTGNETGRKIFTADVKIIIQGSKIVDIDIQDPKWHFDTDEVLKDEIVIMQLMPDLGSVAEKTITAEAVKEEIVTKGFEPDWEPTQVKSIKTDEPCQKRMKSMHSDGP